MDTFVEFIAWLWEHRGTVTIYGGVAFIVRELTKRMAVQQIEHYLNPQARDIREIKRNVKILQEHLGVEGEWNGDGGISYAKVRRSLNQSFATFSKVILRRTLNFRRRRNRVTPKQINKMWLAWLIAMIGGKIAIRYGFKFPDEYHNAVADFLITYVAPFVVAWLDKHKKQEGGPTLANPQSYVSADPRK